METIIGVGFNIPSKEKDFLAINTKGSLSDADIVVFSCTFPYDSYKLDKDGYQGHPLYSTTSSNQLLEHFDHWNAELTNFLDRGKVLFILLEEKKTFYLYTGKKKVTERQETTMVGKHHNYEFLPSSLNAEILNGHGSTIYPCSSLVKDFNDAVNEVYQFEAHVKTEVPSSTLFTTKAKDKVLGLHKIYGKGHIVFVPSITLPSSFKTEAGKFNAKAFRWGSRFKESLSGLSKALRAEDNITPTPNWTQQKDYMLPNAVETLKKIKTAEGQISALESKISKYRELLADQEECKNLLYETGKPLEYIVTKTLNALGYEAENFDDGMLEMDQIILSPEGDRFVGECEGKDNKDIDISKFRQLQDALNADFARDEVSEKAYGILFGNPQRLIDPKSRTLDFTDKCKNGAQREGIALVKTADLFQIAQYFTDHVNDEYKKACRMAIKEQLGKVVNFPPIPED
ncbi:hypothetical protein HQN86_12710 [Pedobacter panaciterrae]|uniref:hypothetical protein n=1 Tax=Pedobacter panaciterrae TaxID=363849 RepID=UPI00155DA04D|nr:hypothetical protein [Pedobacter panaciterrae]NQX54478.1 hypothetical protein [Pedobacter panaciterrae]